MTTPATGRAPATPLITHDPTFSIWTTGDTLYEKWQCHWTGEGRGFAGLVRIDGEAHCFAGLLTGMCPALPQQSCEILPTRTIYRFADARIELTVTFCSPLLIENLDVLSRPVSYVTVSAKSRNGNTHRVEVYFDIGMEWPTDHHGDVVNGYRSRIKGLEVMRASCANVQVLTGCGDNHRCNWGTVVLATTSGEGVQSAIGSNDTRDVWARTGVLPTDDFAEFPRAANHGYPVMAVAWDLHDVGTTSVECHALLGYDEQFQMEYLHRKVRPYWRRNGQTFATLLRTAEAEYQAIIESCVVFDAKVVADLTRVGGAAYARIGCLAYRQGLAAHGLAVDLDGTPLHLSKENFSNGCIATVDVTYPGAPFFLLYSPELLKAQIRPILEYAQSTRWRFDFAPHDLGVYPHANGQVYGGGEDSDKDQMPVEECGNMILLVGGLFRINGEHDFARKYWALLTKWADYLVAKGLDPDNQLCTDDFAGHLAHNANLSLKAITAIGSFAQMAQVIEPAKALHYRAKAEQMAADWVTMAADGDHYRLTFDKPNSWSQKYNLIWDKLLDLKLFPASVAHDEVAYYQKVQTRYGLALDSRQSYTKLDWIVWSASLAERNADFRALVAPLATWAAETPSRVPLTDWYWITDGKQAGFQARSVVCGVFVGLLVDKVCGWQSARVGASA